MNTKILVIGTLPPPAGGMETIMEQMTHLKVEHYTIIPFNVAKNKLIKSNIIFNSINFMYRCIKLFITILIKKPSLIHIHTTVERDFWQKAIFFKIAQVLKIKTILHLHGGAFPKFYQTSNNKKTIINILQSANGLIVLTNRWKEFYQQIKANKNIHVINNAIDLKSLKKYYKYKQKSKQLKLLFVGRISKPKGIYELLEAIKMLKKENIHLNIMGAFNNNEMEIKKLCQKYSIEDKVTFLGVIQGNDRFKHFANSDIFILPSHWEGLPFSILEAMAFGMPIIATKVGAIPELIKKDNGILIPIKNSSEIHKKILFFIKRPKIIKTISKRNKQTMKQYDILNFQNRLIKVYDDTI
jgi:glycosyltransferase involved in cell wall biosynthesis